MDQKIISTNSFQEVTSKVRQVLSDTIIIFDVDDVLIQPIDQALKINNVKRMAELFEPIKAKLKMEQCWELESLILLQSKYELVDTKMVSFVRELQTKNTKVLALTQLFTGKFGQVPSLEDWRINSLNSFGFNFGESWANIKEKIFYKFPSLRYPEFYPIFKDGVVFTCDHPKGKILNCFLEYTHLAPKKIIMIDDKKRNLESVLGLAKKKQIKFLGINYTAAHDYNQKSFNSKRTQYQLEVLEQDHIWLSDEEADRRMMLS